uniref:Uncharacterized protein n=1 Tax=Poecilia mexicana TaxID=48701 RepID=A0A3B3YM12_9TELE
MRGTVCVGCRSLRPGRHIEDDNIVPELAHIHPRERPDWEETIIRHALLHKNKNIKSHKTHGHFPKLAECAHFHYENVDFGTIQVHLFLLQYIPTNLLKISFNSINEVNCNKRIGYVPLWS